MRSPRMAVVQLHPQAPDGALTTVHVAVHDAAATDLRVALLRGQRLGAWCAARGVDDALVGGFFTRPATEPLGELRTRGILRRHVAFDAPWDDLRACVHVGGGAVERHPRAALGVGDGRLLAVVCDGRARTDAGLTLEELAEVLVALGAREALNLDGGGSATLVAGGRVRNRPRAGFGVPEPGGRPVATALLFVPRR